MKSLITKSAEVEALKTLAIEVLPEIVTRRDTLLASAKGVKEISDEFSQDDAATVASSLKKLISEVEDSRQIVKAPVLAIGNKIDQAAKDFVAKSKLELKRITDLLTDFAEKQRLAAQELERRRLNELARIESERVAAENAQLEAQRLIDQAAEQKRLEDSGKFVDPVTQPAISIETVKDAMAVRQQATVTLEALKPVATSVSKAVAPAPIVTQAAQSKMVFKFRVVDLAKVYAAKPQFCILEISTAAVKTAIGNGLRECAGLEIYQEMETKIK